MTRTALLLFGLGLLGTSRAQAQLYVFVRTDKPDVVYTVDRDNGRTKAVATFQAKKTGAIWRLLVESTDPGYGAVFCVSQKGGQDPHHFYSVGKLTSKEAIEDAREQARNYARTIKETPYIMRTFHNTNKYPLEKPVTKYTTMGVRG